MTITTETATLIDILASAASKIGSTPASQKINSLIVDLLPPSEGAALQQQIDELITSSDIKEANLSLARSQLATAKSLVVVMADETSTDPEKATALLGLQQLLDEALAPLNV